MIKIMIVKSCRTCDFRGRKGNQPCFHPHGSGEVCIDEEFEKFPKWCPLKNFKEAHHD